MSTILTNLAAALVIAIPLALLICRFVWPRYFPWWGVVIGATCASWLLYEAQVHLRDGVLLDEQALCLAEVMDRGSPVSRDCPLPIVHYWDIPVYLRWAHGIVWLVLFAPLYGVALFIKKRRRAIAA